MPDFNYTIDVISKGSKLIEILMIDTIKLCGNTKFSMNPFEKIDANIPSFENKYESEMANLYILDLENKLKLASKNRVPYIIVAGHFPVFSVASHGSTQCLIDYLMPLLHKYGVSIYLAGHDHNLQHISHTFMNSTVDYMVSGANSLNTNSLNHFSSIPNDSLKYRWPTDTDLYNGGFLYMKANNKSLNVSFVKSDGSILYEKLILPR